MTYKLPNKKQIAAYKAQAKLVLDRLGFRPATPIQPQAPDGHTYTRRDFEVDTECGLLYCSIHDDWLACIFDDVKAAVAHPTMAGSQVLNPHSGKWNWDDIEAFEQAAAKIVAPLGYQIEPVVGGYIWKNETLNEGSWRIDTQGEAVIAAKAHAGQVALDIVKSIQQILSGNEWDSDTPGFIADVMTDHGYEIDPCDDDQPDNMIEYSVCQDCLMFIANGDSPDDEFTERVEVNITNELNGRKGHFFCGVAATEDDPEGSGDEEFSWAECELCRSTLGGSRHGATLAIIGETHDPVSV